jgi:hypothetical protein
MSLVLAVLSDYFYKLGSFISLSPCLFTYGHNGQLQKQHQYARDYDDDFIDD